MKGIHYTSKKNLESIRESGLVPRRCYEGSLVGKYASWVWSHELPRDVERAWITMVMNRDSTDEVVKLEVRYTLEDVYKDGKKPDEQVHVFNTWPMRGRECSAHLIKKAVPFSRIRVTETHKAVVEKHQRSNKEV